MFITSLKTRFIHI